MSAANCFVTDFYYLAAAKGLNADQLLRDAGVDRADIDSPETRIVSEKLASMVEGVLDQLQDESMNLSDSPIPRGAFYLMGKLAVGELTLRRALLVGADFYRMVTDAYRVSLEEGDENATLTFAMSSPQQDKYYLFAEITLLAWHRLASWLILESIALHDIYFDYPAPGHVSEYAYLLPGRHVFDSGTLGFSFSKCFLDREVCQSRETLKTLIKNCPMELFVQPRQDYTVSGLLKKNLRQDLSGCFPRIEEAAEALHLTRRTLMRKLKEEGTSYQEIKDLVRRDRAIFLLKNRVIPVSEVAEAVGFSDPAVFARAFKNWTGVSPRDFRIGTD
jgi:AraC-like DNA-binding protein